MTVRSLYTPDRARGSENEAIWLDYRLEAGFEGTLKARSRREAVTPNKNSDIAAAIL